MPERIPEGWRECALREVVPDAVYGINESLGAGPGVPVLRMNNIKDGEAALDVIKYSDSLAAQRLLLQPGDVLFNRTNSIDHVGRTGIWRGQLPIASFASYLVRLEPDEQHLDSEFLNRWLNWNATQLRIRRFATPGVHQVNINPTNLRRTTIRLPNSVNEQQRIAEILDTVDEAIRKTEEIIAKLRQVKQGLLHDLLTRGIDDNGELRDPERHPEQFKDSPLGRIPKGWEVRPLESISIKIVDGAHHTPHYVERGVPFLRVTDLRSATIDRGSTKYVSRAEHRSLKKRCDPRRGDLLLSKNGTVGIPRLVDWDWDFSIFVSLALIRPTAGAINVEYLELVLGSQVVRRQIYRRAKQGTVTNLHLEEIRQFQIPMPLASEQAGIVAAARSLHARLVDESNHLAKIRRVKQGLMEDLLTGRVRVSSFEKGYA